MRLSRMILVALTTLVVPVVLGAGPCQKDDERLTAAEAAEALDQVAVSEQALTLSSGSIEIATDFTLGGAVEAAAEEIRTFVKQQLPCAEITIAGASLTVVYGALPGDCTYRGQHYEGTHTITVVSAAPGSLVVDHAWEGLTNGVVSVTGSARVTWGGASLQRNVVHDLTWTRVKDGRQGTGTGDRTQTALAGGITEGIRIDGERTWTSEARTWLLDIDGVEARWVDPIPQAGTYWLTNPTGKVLTLTFARVDADTIGVTIASGGYDFSFDVTALGQVTER